MWTLWSEYYWNMRTFLKYEDPTSAVLQVYFQVRRCTKEVSQRWVRHLPYLLELLLPLNYSRTGHRSSGSSWTKYIPPLNSPRTMRVRCLSWWAWLNGKSIRTNSWCSDSLKSMIAQRYSIAESGRYLSLWRANFIFVLAKSARSVVRTRAQKCCDNNCTRLVQCIRTCIQGVVPPEVLEHWSLIKKLRTSHQRCLLILFVLVLFPGPLFRGKGGKRVGAHSLRMRQKKREPWAEASLSLDWAILCM